MVDLIPVEHDPFALLAPVDHDPWAQYVEPPAAGQRPMPASDAGTQDVPTAQEYLLSPAGQAAGMALAAKARGDIGEAQNALWGMTGVPDIQQGAQAWQRGEYLPAFGQMATGAAQLGSLAAPAARGTASLGREALGAVPGVMGDTAGTLRLFHGSPHDFDAFDSSKIGTGEGAQAYGHGLYFAGNPAVAESYRQPPSQAPVGQSSYSWVLAKTAANKATDAGLVGDDAKQSALNWLNEQALSRPNDRQAAYDAMNNFDALLAPKGRMYEAQINADPEHFLDWDKPFNEQSPQVKAAINGLADSNPVLRDIKGPAGSDYYRSIAEGLAKKQPEPPPGWTSVPGGPVSYDAQIHDPTAAANALRDAGIPGIRYLDQRSRGAGEGTHNYVVFDDKLIDIIKKYGLAGLIAGGAATVGGSPAGATHVIPVAHDPFAGAQP
jgi:hypothetical protein